MARQKAKAKKTSSNTRKKSANDQGSGLLPWLGLIGSVAGNIQQYASNQDLQAHAQHLELQVEQLGRYLQLARSEAQQYHQALVDAVSRLSQAHAQIATQVSMLNALRAQNADNLRQLTEERQRLAAGHALQQTLQQQIQAAEQRAAELQAQLNELHGEEDGGGPEE